MSKEDREAMAATLGVPVRTLTLALIHSSFANERKAQGVQSNELRALLGDAVLRTVLVEKLLADGVAKKGDITQAISSMISNVTCASIARGLGLEPLILVSAGFQVRPFPDSVLATVSEALVGGLYKDEGWDSARAFVLKHWGAVPPAAGGDLEFDFGM